MNEWLRLLALSLTVSCLLTAQTAALANASAKISRHVGSTHPVMLVDTAVVEGCERCHRNALSLEQWSAIDLAELITQMIRGRVDHVVPIPALSEDEVEELAAALTGR